MSNQPTPILSITLECRLLPGIHRFSLPADTRVGELIDKILEHLQHSDAAEEAQAMLEYYKPGLELQQGKRLIPLDPQHTLQEAGLYDGATCRMGGLPRKEKQLFCRWC